jgi:hypothetical protein
MINSVTQHANGELILPCYRVLLIDAVDSMMRWVQPVLYRYEKSSRERNRFTNRPSPELLQEDKETSASDGGRLPVPT